MYFEFYINLYMYVFYIFYNFGDCFMYSEIQRIYLFQVDVFKYLFIYDMFIIFYSLQKKLESDLCNYKVIYINCVLDVNYVYSIIEIFIKLIYVRINSNKF